MNKMFARKKILGFLLLMMVCSTAVPTALANNSEEPDIETKTELVPYEAEPTSEDYVDSPYEVELINNDIDQITLVNATWDHTLEYNVTFQILNVSKGTFDDAVILNATSIRFNATQIMYGAKKTGKAYIRVWSNETVAFKDTLVLEGFYTANPIWLIGVVVAIVTADVALLVEFVKLYTTILSIPEGESQNEPEPQPAPEFPLGFALEIAFIPVIIYILRKSRQRKKVLP